MSIASDVKSIAKESIGWSIALSVALIVLGLLAIMIPLAAGVAANVVVAWLLLIAGVGHLLFAWHVKGVGGAVWETLVGLAYIAAGIYMLMHPLLGLLSLTLVLAVYLLVKGVSLTMLGFQMKALPGSGWLIFDGVISIILAGFIYWNLPYAAEWLIGTYIGITILFSGISRLMLSLGAKKLVAATA
jgi:uncharacterized membrane protein HdeD (DUF308 family)